MNVSGYKCESKDMYKYELMYLFKNNKIYRERDGVI